MSEWAPATEVEAAMQDALRAGDQELYFRILARAELLLPVSAEALAGRTPMGWGTWTTGGRTHVLAFTSGDALQICLADNAGSARRMPYYELAGSWPNLEWWLAVNPGLPIEGYLPAWFVSQLSRGDVRLPGRTMGARARLERAESVARARATAVVPGQIIQPGPDTPSSRAERLGRMARAADQAARRPTTIEGTATVHPPEPLPRAALPAAPPGSTAPAPLTHAAPATEGVARGVSPVSPAAAQGWSTSSPVAEPAQEFHSGTGRASVAPPAPLPTDGSLTSRLGAVPSAPATGRFGVPPVPEGALAPPVIAPTSPGRASVPPGSAARPPRDDEYGGAGRGVVPPATGEVTAPPGPYPPSGPFAPPHRPDEPYAEPAVEPSTATGIAPVRDQAWPANPALAPANGQGTDAEPRDIAPPTMQQDPGPTALDGPTPPTGLDGPTTATAAESPSTAESPTGPTAAESPTALDGPTGPASWPESGPLPAGPTSQPYLTEQTAAREPAAAHSAETGEASVPSEAPNDDPGQSADDATQAEPPGVAFEPANVVEESLLAAAGDGSTDSFLSTLLLARVLLPASPDSKPGTKPGADGFAWRTESLDGEPYVVVFTSKERMRDHLDASETTDTLSVKFVQLINRWPDEAWSFAVNPGTPVGAKLPGAQIVALASWAAEVGLGADDPEEPMAGATGEMATPRPSETAQERPRPTMMQKTIAPSQVDYYLDRGYDRISGFVHRATEVTHLKTPAQLYAALGLGYPDSPFDPTASEVYVLRWPAFRPSLYRIPYGGQNETAMRAMEGWVIERAPFRGNGFAPGDTSDVIAEFKVDSARLPHGAQLWRVRADGAEELVATLDSDAPTWRKES